MTATAAHMGEQEGRASRASEQEGRGETYASAWRMLSFHTGWLRESRPPGEGRERRGGEGREEVLRAYQPVSGEW